MAYHKLSSNCHKLSFYSIYCSRIFICNGIFSYWIPSIQLITHFLHKLLVLWYIFCSYHCLYAEKKVWIKLIRKNMPIKISKNSVQLRSCKGYVFIWLMPLSLWSVVYVGHFFIPFNSAPFDHKNNLSRYNENVQKLC